MHDDAPEYRTLWPDEDRGFPEIERLDPGPAHGGCSRWPQIGWLAAALGFCLAVWGALAGLVRVLL